MLSIPYAYMVTAITLLFRQPTYSHNIKPPFWEITEYMSGNDRMLFDITANIIMLFPLGIFVPLWFRKADTPKKTALAGLGVSLFIELAQLITTRGFFEIDDLVHNTLGAYIGSFIGCFLAKRLYSADNSST